VLVDSLGAWFPDSARLLYLTVQTGLVLVGVLAGVVLAVRSDFRFLTRPLCDRRSVLSVRRRRQLVTCNPAVILSVVVYAGLMLWEEFLK
jgi:hypothetical protein